MTTPLFWIDDNYDRDHASDGHSRYGAYLRQHERELAEDLEWGPHSFLASIWRIGSMPVMAPGYIRQHPQVEAHRLSRDDYDGHLLGVVTLAMRPPADASRWASWTERWEEPRRHPAQLWRVEYHVELPDELLADIPTSGCLDAPAITLLAQRLALATSDALNASLLGATPQIEIRSEARVLDRCADHD
jgi:hypothetical protein